MRQQVIPNIGTVTYPDKWCVAYNPQYVIVEAPNIGTVTLRITDTSQPSRIYPLSIALYKGRAEADISNALQMLTSGTMAKRWSYIHVAVMVNAVAVTSFHLYSLYGQLQTDEHYSSYGAFEQMNGETIFTRHVVWFKEYPFSVSFFRRDASEPIRRSVDGQREETLSDARFQIFDVDLTDTSAKNSVLLTHHQTASTLAVFDKTFDHTFVEQYGELFTEVVKVKVSQETEGYYLRWIDSFGFVQYYLFPKGTVEDAVNYGSYSVEAEQGYDMTRPLTSTVEKHLKCCAVNLHSKHIHYVSSISNSACVELYDRGQWLPVTVESTTTVNEGKVLQDYEITIIVKQQFQTLM